MNYIDTLVIGGGQAGLAMSRCLSDRSVDHVIVERGRVAERWRTERWDSLRLLTPNWQTRLPGFRYSGPEPDSYMSMAQLIDFFEQYAASFDAPIQSDTAVLAVERAGSQFRVQTSRGTWLARHVVVATGYSDLPLIPPLARRLSPRVVQIVPTQYRNPAQLPPGGVLVVGASATGVQLADEIHEQRVRHDRACDRRLDQHVLTGAKRGERDDELGQVAERRVQQSTNRVAGRRRHRFGGVTEQRCEWNDCEYGQHEEQRVGIRRGPLRKEHDRNENEQPQKPIVLEFLQQLGHGASCWCDLEHPISRWTNNSVASVGSWVQGAGCLVRSECWVPGSGLGSGLLVHRSARPFNSVSSHPDPSTPNPERTQQPAPSALNPTDLLKRLLTSSSLRTSG